MAMTENGVTTTKENGQEQYQKFTRGGWTYIQYDYRHYNGALFSCVKKSLDKCRAERDKWIEKQDNRVTA
jgi:hypothetical protein